MDRLFKVLYDFFIYLGDDDEFSQQCNNNSFINLFGFKNVTTDNETLSFLAEHCCKIVIALAKYSSLFGNSYNFDTTESLIRNSDVIFIGNLLLKVAVIFLNNGTKVSHLKPFCQFFSWIILYFCKNVSQKIYSFLISLYIRPEVDELIGTYLQ